MPIKCPRCGSANVEKTWYHYAKKGAAITAGTAFSIGVGALMGMVGIGGSSNRGLDLKSGVDYANNNVNDEYECHSCGKEFSIVHGD